MNASIRHVFAAVVVSVLFAVAGCQTTPDTAEKKSMLDNDSSNALANFKLADPSLASVLNNARGYAIFPSIGKGGLIVGGAYGRGTVYQNGAMIGYADMTQANIGAQIGGQAFAELVVFQTQLALDNFKKNEMTFTADVSAVAADKGAAAAAKFENGVAVFINGEKGLMASAVVGGQKFNYVAAADAKTTKTETHEKTVETPTGTVHTETEKKSD